jgi:diadenosine tetraphosphate (Ap4A) HIT family hydrolase
MQDEELTAIILKTLRDSNSPSGVEDIVEIARAHGVDEHYQIHRIGRRLLDQGLVDSVGFTEQSLQASINERGRAALEKGDFQAITDRAKAALLDPEHNVNFPKATGRDASS